MYVDMLHGSNIRVLFNIAILQGGLFFYYKKHERRETGHIWRPFELSIHQRILRGKCVCVSNRTSVKRTI